MADALWILVANASRARLFSTDELAENWTLREEFYHEESRVLSHELQSQPDKLEGGIRRKPETERSAHGLQEQEQERFARQLAERLDQGLNAQAFERLVVAAPPTFLGMLRKAISPQVQKRLMLDLRADYSNVPVRELPERIPII